MQLNDLCLLEQICIRIEHAIHNSVDQREQYERVCREMLTKVVQAQAQAGAVQVQTPSTIDHNDEIQNQDRDTRDLNAVDEEAQSEHQEATDISFDASQADNHFKFKLTENPNELYERSECDKLYTKKSSSSEHRERHKSMKFKCDESVKLSKHKMMRRHGN
jgi:hypothetical protein